MATLEAQPLPNARPLLVVHVMHILGELTCPASLLRGAFLSTAILASLNS